MLNRFTVMPGDVVLFLDEKLPHVDAQDVNCVAVVIDERGALYIDKKPFFKKLRWVPLQSISRLSNLVMRRASIDDTLREQIASFFLAKLKNPPEFEAGLQHMLLENYALFSRGTLFPVWRPYSSIDSYNQAWDSLVKQLKPLDGIFTVRLDDRVSRFIARATHGPWSHVAMYEGNGQISESVTSGMRWVPLETYKGSKFWIGAYRHVSAKGRKNLVVLPEKEIRQRFKDGYNYRGAIAYGIRSFCNDHSHELIPNSMIYGGGSVPPLCSVIHIPSR